MKERIENHEKGYDTKLIASDWRYSASVVGLILYFDYLENMNGKVFCEKTEDAIFYCSQDVNEENYLKFAEYYFKEEMHHKVVEEWLRKEEFSEDEIKRINDKLVGNTVMKSVFEKNKFDGTNREKILELIDQNRERLIKETYRNKKNLYANFANTNLFLNNEEQAHCRLIGYNIDEARKSKSISYRFDTDTFIQQDCLEFDFIPFAFTNTREALYVNNNLSIVQLMQTFRRLQEIVEKSRKEGREKGSENAKEALFQALIVSADFIDFDVEVIVKDREHSFFETLFIRKNAIDIMRKISSETAKSFCISIPRKQGEDNYINIQVEVVNHILNHVLLDDLIDLFLKDGKRSYLVRQFIDINCKIKGGKDMTQEMKSAYACAKEVVKKLEENKVNAYRQKLISGIIFHDYDRVCEILLQLSNYSGVNFSFAYSLFEDFEVHKEIAYTFVNALQKNDNNINNNGKEG